MAPASHPKLADRVWLKERYVEQQKNIHEIAEELGVSGGAVLNWLKRHCIQTRPRGYPGYNRHPLLSDKAWLENKYINEEMSCQQIADELGVWYLTVFNWIKRHGIPTRRRGYNEKYYGRIGRYKDDRGYVHVWQPDHPYAHKGFVPEHRLVMEKHLGRYLERHELVHHINKIRDHNKIENLKLMQSHSEHRDEHTLPENPKLALLRDKKWLAEQLEDRSFSEIARELGCDVATVLRRARKHGLKSRQINQYK